MERKIYVACLASYNAGSLVGAWIDMAEVMGPSDLAARFQAAIKGEEWAIHDHEGWYGLLKGEWPDLAKLCALHDELSENEDSHDEETLQAAIEIAGDEFTKALTEFRGKHDRKGDYAAQFADDCGDLASVPEHYRNYIDFEAIERDYELNGDISVCTVNGTRYIFGQW